MRKDIKSNKKAISPLIATILLIAFLVALAIILVLWGRGIISGILEKEGPASEGRVECETNVRIDVGDKACYDHDKKVVKIEIENEKSINIINFQARVYGIGTSFSTASGTTIEPLGKRETNFKYGAELNTPQGIEIYPTILVEGLAVVCTDQGLDVRLESC